MPQYYGGMQDRSGEIRNTFRESVQQFVDVVERKPPDAWDKPGLGEWTVRELVAHVVGMIDGIAGIRWAACAVRCGERRRLLCSGHVQATDT